MASCGALVTYATKYGSTREYAETIGKVLEARVLRASEVDDKDLVKASLIVLGSPIYGPVILDEMSYFLDTYSQFLKGKSVAAFVVCGDTLWNPKAGEGGSRNLVKLISLLPATPIAQTILGGRMRMEDLDEKDLPRIHAFYNRLGREATGFDRMDLESARIWAKGLGHPRLFPRHGS